MVYEANLRAFRKWCKDHRFNSVYEEEKEFLRIGDFFVEFSLSKNMDGSFSGFCSVRKFENKTFELVEKDEVDNNTKKEIHEKFEEFSKRHNCVNKIHTV